MTLETNVTVAIYTLRVQYKRQKIQVSFLYIYIYIRGGYRDSRIRDITKGGGHCIRRAPLVHATEVSAYDGAADVTFLAGYIIYCFSNRKIS